MMESIDTILDRVFPKTLDVERVTMEQLAEMKTQIRKALPPDTNVELTLLLNTIQLSLWVPGPLAKQQSEHGDGRYHRACQVRS